MSRSSLAELQQRFQSYVQRHAGEVDSFVVTDEKAPARERMDVYAHAYRLRLVEVLGNDYPALQAVAGPADFDRIGRAYIDAHPSEHASVRWFGRHLASFLRAQESPRPVLAEMAEFEWAQGEAFDARDASPVTLETIVGIPGDRWPGLCLTPHPSLRRVDLEWNVPAIVDAVQNTAALPEPARDTSRSWLLWRRELTVRWRPIAADEAAAIDAVCDGAKFGDVCGLLCEHVDPDDIAMHAAGLLKRWVTDGLIAGVRSS